jgi:hypothetical protein
MRNMNMAPRSGQIALGHGAVIQSARKSASRPARAATRPDPDPHRGGDMAGADEEQPEAQQPDAGHPLSAGRTDEVDQASETERDEEGEAKAERQQVVDRGTRPPRSTATGGRPHSRGGPPLKRSAIKTTWAATAANRNRLSIRKTSPQCPAASPLPADAIRPIFAQLSCNPALSLPKRNVPAFGTHLHQLRPTH